MEKTHLQSNLSFRLMALEYRWRDRRQPPFEILQDIGVKPGMAVLDFGCGPGSFSLAAAKLVGSAGKVYAVDIHPLAITSVKHAALRENIDNIRPVLGNDIPGVSEATIDMVLMFDVLHHISDPGPVLARFQELLRSGGVLSVRDHRLNQAELLAAITASGHFRPLGQNRWVYQFKKTGTDEVGI
jgi:2-polyprenyl-3-methyl-5-hydroxy-6-metoxy-1,4-benzoquinol methylase